MASAVSSVSPSPLTDEERTLLRDRLHTFGRSILTGKLALVAVNLSNCGLQNVDVLAKLPHLQKVDLSHNEVSDVSPLAGNHALKELNLSHNKLSSLEAFDEAGAFAVGTRTLARLNVSFNGIEALPENFNCTYLTHLDVSHNRVAKIRGLKQLTFLAELDLSYNCLTATTGVGAVAANVSSLSLAHNSISKIGPKFMQFGVLRSLDLSHNRICDLYNLSHCSVLRSLNLRQNFLSGVRQTEYLAKLNSLESLMIEDNALATQTDGFYRIIFRLENLTELNGEEISPEDRVKAANTYGGLELDHRFVASLFSRCAVSDLCWSLGTTKSCMFRRAGLIVRGALFAFFLAVELCTLGMFLIFRSKTRFGFGRLNAILPDCLCMPQRQRARKGRVSRLSFGTRVRNMLSR